MLRRLWSGLILAVMLLILPTAADAAIIIDPGYRQTEQELELSLAYYMPADTFTIHGDWTLSDTFSVSGYLEINEGELIYGYLEGFNVFGPIGLSYGLVQNEEDLFYRAGASVVFGRGALGGMVSGDLFYGKENARGAGRAVVLWRPAENMQFLAGLYAEGRYIIASDWWFEKFEPHPYLQANIRQGLGDFELQVTGSVILDLECDLDLALLYPLGERGRVGGIVSFDRDADGSEWTTSYGVEVAWSL